MSTAPKDLLTKADASIEWYWKFGIQRSEPRYEVSRGTWLDSVYRCRERARAMLRAESTSKPCMAIWGPSQTGKSTLLSGYLDDPTDALGDRSALKWSDAEPVRFVVGEDKSDRVIVLNPFNFGSDASGCVSRFVLCDSVDDPSHPVTIELATEAQVMHALAVGYLSECDSKNAQKEEVSWTADSFKSLLDKQRPAGPMQRVAFEALQQLAETLDLLVLSQLPRYVNLQNHWETSLRPQMLQTVALLGSVESVEKFAFELLWDSWTSLTQTFKALATKRRQIAQQWGDAPIRASYRTAAVLLDIDSYKKCEEKPDTRRKVDALMAQVTSAAVCIGQSGGNPLVRGSQDFGYFQALVWELRIPLRRDVLRQRAPVLSAFFEKADMLDFPGVANSFGNANKHTDENVAKSPVIALTEILKRGKTASIVVTSARNLDIDGFSLLMRLGRFPAQPVQLVSGIRSWLKAFGQSWPPHGRAMPLNLVMTFCATLVNQVITAGTRDGLQGCFDQLKSLGYLADPKTVNALATNYPQFPEGHITGTPDQQKQALEAIIADDGFLPRFGDSAESFREMHANGGTDHVFRCLTVQASASRRAAIVAERLDEAATHLQQLILQHTPSESAAADERNRALDAWSAAIVEKMKEPAPYEAIVDSVTRLSRYLRSFINIEPDELDDVPQNAINLRLNVRNFIEKQFRAWQAKRGDFPHLQMIGLSESTQATRILSYLIEASNDGSVETFFRDNLGHLNSRLEGKHARRFLAVQMNNALLNRAKLSPAPHRAVTEGDDSVRAVLESLATAEESRNPEPDQSPHYHTTIYPLLLRLAEIKTFTAGSRPAQTGDAELITISKLP